MLLIKEAERTLLHSPPRAALQKKKKGLHKNKDHLVSTLYYTTIFALFILNYFCTIYTQLLFALFILNYFCTIYT